MKTAIETALAIKAALDSSGMHRARISEKSVKNAANIDVDKSESLHPAFIVSLIAELAMRDISFAPIPNGGFGVMYISALTAAKMLIIKSENEK